MKPYYLLLFIVISTMFLKCESADDLVEPPSQKQTSIFKYDWKMIVTSITYSSGTEANPLYSSMIRGDTNYQDDVTDTHRFALVQNDNEMVLKPSTKNTIFGISGYENWTFNYQMSDVVLMFEGVSLVENLWWPSCSSTGLYKSGFKFEGTLVPGTEDAPEFKGTYLWYENKDETTCVRIEGEMTVLKDL